jgi:hypothetical protein
LSGPVDSVEICFSIRSNSSCFRAASGVRLAAQKLGCVICHPVLEVGRGLWAVCEGSKTVTHRMLQVRCRSNDTRHWQSQWHPIPLATSTRHHFLVMTVRSLARKCLETHPSMSWMFVIRSRRFRIDQPDGLGNIAQLDQWVAQALFGLGPQDLSRTAAGLPRRGTVVRLSQRELSGRWINTCPTIRHRSELCGPLAKILIFKSISDAWG